MKLAHEFIIARRSSRAFVVKKGQVLRVTAHEGRQVADIRFLNAHDYREQFAARWSIPMNSIEGISGERVERQSSVTYPCRTEDDPGSPVVFTESFPTQNGRARFVPAALASVASAGAVTRTNGLPAYASARHSATAFALAPARGRA